MVRHHVHRDFGFLSAHSLFPAPNFLCALQFQDARQPFEIVSHRLERQFQLVARQPQIPHSPVMLPLLPVGKYPLDAAAHPALAPVLRAVVFREFDVVRALLGDLAGDAVLPQPSLIGFGVVGFVSVKTPAVGRCDTLQQVGVVGVGGADDRRPDQLMFAVAADMRHVAVVALAVFARVTGIGIRGLAGARRLGVRALAAGFHQRRIHQRDTFDDVAARFQLRVEQGEQDFMQSALDESLTKAANRRLIRHGLVRVELHELLEAQPVLELFLGLRVTQAIEVLQDHHAQQHADTAGRPPALTIGGRDAGLGLGEIHFARNRFQHVVGRGALLHRQIKKGGLVLAFGLHGLLMRLLQPLFKDFCRDFDWYCRSSWPALTSQLAHSVK